MAGFYQPDLHGFDVCMYVPVCACEWANAIKMISSSLTPDAQQVLGLYGGFFPSLEPVCV